MLRIVRKIINSIALVPSGLALLFLGFALLLANVEIDYSSYPFLDFLSVSDPDDSQAILAFIIGGIFTLTVFSYTMVMNVLNRNINNYSPRLIPLLLSQKHHQVILGFSTGTIIYALVLSLALANDNKEYFPTIAGGVGIIFTITCVMLFIYFLHTVSQSVHINHILRNVYDLNIKNLEKLKNNIADLSPTDNLEPLSHNFETTDCGYLNNPNYEKLESILKENQLQLHIAKPPGEFFFEHETLFTINKEISEKIEKKIFKALSVTEEVTLDVPETGLKHLVEVICKASSRLLMIRGQHLRG